MYYYKDYHRSMKVWYKRSRSKEKTTQAHVNILGISKIDKTLKIPYGKKSQSTMQTHKGIPVITNMDEVGEEAEEIIEAEVEDLPEEEDNLETLVPEPEMENGTIHATYVVKQDTLQRTATATTRIVTLTTTKIYNATIVRKMGISKTNAERRKVTVDRILKERTKLNLLEINLRSVSAITAKLHSQHNIKR
jgi:hypothetical protein